MGRHHLILVLLVLPRAKKGDSAMSLQKMLSREDIERRAFQVIWHGVANPVMTSRTGWREELSESSKGVRSRPFRDSHSRQAALAPVTVRGEAWLPLPG